MNKKKLPEVPSTADTSYFVEEKEPSSALRGNCQDCGQEVRREQTGLEIATGKQETNWR